MRVNKPIATFVAAASFLTGCSASDDSGKASPATADSSSEVAPTVNRVEFSNNNYILEDSLEEIFGIPSVQPGSETSVDEILCVDTTLVVSRFHDRALEIPDAVNCSDGNPRLNAQEREVLQLRREALLTPPTTAPLPIGDR